MKAARDCKPDRLSIEHRRDSERRRYIAYLDGLICEMTAIVDRTYREDFILHEATEQRRALA